LLNLFRSIDAPKLIQFLGEHGVDPKNVLVRKGSVDKVGELFAKAKSFLDSSSSNKRISDVSR
jgi:hypothetical protein